MLNPIKVAIFVRTAANSPILTNQIELGATPAEEQEVGTAMLRVASCGDLVKRGERFNAVALFQRR